MITKKIGFLILLFILEIICEPFIFNYKCNNKDIYINITNICKNSQDSFDLLKQCMGEDISSCMEKTKIIIPNNFCDLQKRLILGDCIFRDKKISRDKYFCELNMCLEKINKFIKMSTS